MRWQYLSDIEVDNTYKSFEKPHPDIYKYLKYQKEEFLIYLDDESMKNVFKALVFNCKNFIGQSSLANFTFDLNSIFDFDKNPHCRRYSDLYKLIEKAPLPLCHAIKKLDFSNNNLNSLRNLYFDTSKFPHVEIIDFRNNFRSHDENDYRDKMELMKAEFTRCQAGAKLPGGKFPAQITVIYFSEEWVKSQKWWRAFITKNLEPFVPPNVKMKTDDFHKSFSLRIESVYKYVCEETNCTNNLSDILKKYNLALPLFANRHYTTKVNKLLSSLATTSSQVLIYGVQKIQMEAKADWTSSGRLASILNDMEEEAILPTTTSTKSARNI